MELKGSGSVRVAVAAVAAAAMEPRIRPPASVAAKRRKDWTAFIF